MHEELIRAYWRWFFATNDLMMKWSSLWFSPLFDLLPPQAQARVEKVEDYDRHRVITVRFTR